MNHIYKFAVLAPFALIASTRGPGLFAIAPHVALARSTSSSPVTVKKSHPSGAPRGTHQNTRCRRSKCSVPLRKTEGFTRVEAHGKL